MNKLQAQSGKLKGWSQSAVINPPLSNIANPSGQSSLTLQCNLNPPEVMTIQFEILGSNNQNQPVATIEFCVNGNTVKRKVSVINGMSISGPGNSIKVKSFDESQDSTAPPYTLSILVTPGTRPTGATPPTLQNQPTVFIGAGSSIPANVPIPLDAGITSVWVFAYPNLPGATMDKDKILVTQLDAAGNILRGWQDPTHEGFVPLYPTCTEIFVRNNDIIDIDVSFVFGVDG